MLLSGNFGFWTLVATAILSGIVYMLVRKNTYREDALTVKTAASK